ncbi:hypothetical protein HHI36_011993, partial [Cryptolaemus montrouzieri]
EVGQYLDSQFMEDVLKRAKSDDGDLNIGAEPLNGLINVDELLKRERTEFTGSVQHGLEPNEKSLNKILKEP